MTKNVFFLFFVALFVVGCSGKKGTFLEEVSTKDSVIVSVDKFKDVIKNNNLTLFNVIDHQANAKKIDMYMKPEVTVVFGNPKMGTVLMNCNASMGLDLPLRVLFTTGYDGTTTIVYTNPEYWSLKHNIKDKNCLEIIKKAKRSLSVLVDKIVKK